MLKDLQEFPTLIFQETRLYDDLQFIEFLPGFDGEYF